jgi:quercetin 2,3-dioxygenase
MTTVDLSAMNDKQLLVDALPGETAPYYLASGEGLRYEIDGQLWTVIARSIDTDGLFDAAFILGPRSAGTPFHSLTEYQRSYYVFGGSVQFWLPGESRVLVQGDSIHVPPGVPVAYRILSHMTRMLFFSAQAGALDILLDEDALENARVDAHVYSADGGAGMRSPSGALLLPTAARLHDLPLAEVSDEWDDRLPANVEPYFLRAMTGDLRAWPDAVNAFSSRGRTTAGRYFSVLTTAGAQPYIGRHFHEYHTENFLCLSGRIWLYANGREVLLTPGDFLHAPAGTIHAFEIERHASQMLGILTPTIFEPFFDVTADATEAEIYTERLIDPAAFLGRLAAHAADLDVVQVGPPPVPGIRSTA